MISRTLIFLMLCSLAWAEREHFNRIVGGEDADIKDFPYQLQLQKYDLYHCGASIISPNWALTAAHCIFADPTAPNYNIRAGTSIREVGGDVHEIELIILHPDYEPVDMAYDVALIKVKKTFDINSGKPIKIIKLPDLGNDPVKGSKVTVSGWGVYDEQVGEPSRTLKKVTVAIVDRLTCAKNYSNEGLFIYPSMICAVLPNKDACQGDSGGPLIQHNIQIGVVSWGKDCGDERLPGVYARIGHPEIRKWIKKITGV